MLPTNQVYFWQVTEDAGRHYCFPVAGYVQSFLVYIYVMVIIGIDSLLISMVPIPQY